MSVSDNQYLAHFGIFGMKWGVRRYQNEDGSLTEEGKKRYYKHETDSSGKKDTVVLTDEGAKEFFKGNSSTLTKSGESFLNNPNNDKSLKTAVDAARFERLYNENWINSYNTATNIFNLKIGDLNKSTKFNSDSETSYRKYVNEVNKLWQGIYSDVLIKNFGEHPTLGKDWLNAAMMYTMYSNPDDFIDDDMRKEWAKKEKSK